METAPETQYGNLHNLERASDAGNNAPLIDMAEVSKRLSVCKRTINRLIAAGQFPPPMKLGRASRWLTADIEGYLMKLQQIRDRQSTKMAAEEGVA